MADLRAPDPTLDALDDRFVLVTDYTTNPPIAHHRVDAGADRWSVPRCDESNRGVTDDRACYARWFSVPCRECFPDAPPPGHRPWQRIRNPGVIADPWLAWQVPDAEVAR